MKSNLLKSVLFAIFAVAMGMTAVSCSSNEDNATGSSPVAVPGQDWSKQQAKYTIMFYGCGGGDVDYQLERAITGIVNQLSVPANQVRYTVMYSMSKNGVKYGQKPGDESFYLGEWGTTYRYEMTPQNDFTKEGYRAKYKYKNASEVKLYEVSTITDYIEWAKKTAPADNYILMPINHGGGFDAPTETLTRGIGYDDNHLDKDKSGIGIPVKAFAEALKQTNTHLKAIYWVGCLMGQIEVLTEVAPYCDYQFCSTHVSRAIDYLAYSIVNAINRYPDNFEQAALADGQNLMDSKYIEMFQNITDDKNYPGTHDENCDWGCWRSDKVAAINEQVKRLATLLSDVYDTQKDEIDLATYSTYNYELEYNYLDLIDLATQVAEKLSDERADSIAYDIVEKLQKAVDDACIYRINGLNRKSADGVYIAPLNQKFSIGISIYAANEPMYRIYGQNYVSSAFNAATGWSKWLDKNRVSIFSSKLNPCNDSSWELEWLENPMPEE